MKRIVTNKEAVEITFLRDIFDRDGTTMNKKGETKRFLPLLLQSCMNPENFSLHPVEIRFENQNGEEMVLFSTRYEHGCYKADDIEIKLKAYDPAIKKAGCNPCRNCGRC